MPHLSGTIYQKPLAYLLGLEGVALLRAFAGEHDRDFTEARIAEIRRLLAEPALGGDGAAARRVDTVAGYRVWSATYDEPGNGLFGSEESVVAEILDPLPTGLALDAACGTGRHSERLAALGHRVIGVDSSPEMLALARARVPQADFRPGDLLALPVPDDHVDVAVCALALTHLPDLRPVFAEFARVLRPGGHLVITDVHQELVSLGSVPRVRSTGGEPGLLPAYRHRASDYLDAALPVGLRVRRCAEPRITARVDPDRPAPEIVVGPWDGWPWSLMDIVATAVNAAHADVPALIIWHFQLD
ncbi:class I SAM-dependent methyltransferase [Solwaraspora sp. WMMD1047]|uniref:class I SAM-dependent methyltransferase n=1 Tax=Solwaraspora sp. WMMD1047 TaxID=3016102 RepID=UPI0024172417|nr:class I SAM-dependent methyltransferase [Solwaraspora sp. WMMD1047]MDG4832563.1 class I SAM-dependent methyltransferase [Solwaraspora sp. WMMD1047]